jgi:ribose/xylose/arabinose/galactoside ABC-type transport system permease subunit
MTEQPQELTATQVPAPRAALPAGLKELRRVAEANLIWLILFVTFAYGATVQGFLNSQNLINLVWAAVPMGCMVLGMFFVMLTGGLDLSLESIYGVAPVLGLILLTHVFVGAPPQFALVLCLGTGIFAGLMNGLISVKLRVNPFLVTLAALLFWRGVVIALIPEGIYQLPDGYTVLGGFRFFNAVPLAIVVAVLLFAIAWVVIQRTAFGKAIYAVGSNPAAAYVAGLNVQRIRIAVFIIAGFLAGLGGLIEVGRIGAVVSDLGQNTIMIVFAGVILGGTSMTGGRGKLSGIIAAVLELQLIDNVMTLTGVTPSIRQVVFALVLLVAIYIASLQEHNDSAFE